MINQNQTSKVNCYKSLFKANIATISTNKDWTYGGNLGVVLLQLMLHKKDTTNFLLTNTINDSFSKIIAAIDTPNGVQTNTSISRGLSGFGIVNYLIKSADNSSIKSIDFQKEERMNLYISKSIITEARNNSLDFTHSSIGGAYYLTKCCADDSAIMQNLKKFIKAIPIEVSNNTIKAKNLYMKGTRPDVTALSYAHGLCGVINCCLEMFKRNLEKDHLRKLVDGFIGFIIEQQLDVFDIKQQYQFPKIVYDNPSEVGWYQLDGSSPSGWCSGDLMIGYIILKAGVILNNPSYVLKANQIISKTLERQDFATNRINHYSFCHGAVGIYWILQKCLELDANNTYSEGSKYWFDETIDFLDKQLPFSNERQNFHLLNGWGGVELVFGSLWDTKNAEWDLIFGL